MFAASISKSLNNAEVVKTEWDVTSVVVEENKDEPETVEGQARPEIAQVTEVTKAIVERVAKVLEVAGDTQNVVETVDEKLF